MFHSGDAPHPEERDEAEMDEQHDEITALALRARRGDATAAGAFVRATQADVWRTCANLGRRSDGGSSPDDLTQEVYARAFASLHRFMGRSSARTWLLAIARNVCADSVRAAQRDRRAPVQPDAARVTTDHAESVAVQLVVAGLEPQRREAFVLTQMVGLSYAEAAEVCSCPVGTIRSRVARARADLVEALGGGAQSRAGTG